MWTSLPDVLQPGRQQLDLPPKLPFLGGVVPQDGEGQVVVDADPGRHRLQVVFEEFNALFQRGHAHTPPGSAGKLSRVTLPAAWYSSRPLLVGLEQEPFDTFPGQEEQPPVGMLDQLGPRGLVLLEVEHDVGERRHRDIGRGDPLVDRPLEHAEVPQGRQEPLGDSAESSSSVQSEAVLPSLTHRATVFWISSTLMSLIPLAFIGTSDLGHDIVQEPVGPGGVKVEDAVEAERGAAS